MEAYKFETFVLENGYIQIPEFKKFENKKIQISITFMEPEMIVEKKKVLKDFFEKWGGFFSVEEIDDDRFNYLMEKYK